MAHVSIVNKALRLIGAPRIASFTSGTNEANVAKDIYEETRDAVMSANNWNFATKRVQLAQSSTDPAFEFDNAFPLPSDWLRTVSVHDNDAGHGTILFREEFVGSQRCIVTSSDAVYLRYIFLTEDPGVMDPMFREALAFALARDLAVPIASSNTLRDAYSKEYRRALAQARAKDALGAFPELRPRGSWAASRGGRRRNDFLSD